MTPISFGPFVLDTDPTRLKRNGVEITVQPKVLDLIATLAQHPGTLWSREELVAAVWPSVHVSPNVLDQALRKARQALGDDPAQPRYIEALPRRGWRFVAEVRALPRALGLFGREQELAAALDAIAQPGATLLWGPGGAGKSRLALDVAEAAAAWPGGVIPVDLDAAPDGAPDPLAFAVQAAMGLAIEGAQPVERIGRALGARGRTLLVLDGIDPWASAAAEAVARWCAAAPELSVLATGRRRLDGLSALAIGPLPPAAARALLRARVPPSAGALSDAQIEALLAHLDGLPLAIELAAARLGIVAPETLAERLADGIRVLGGSLEASLRQSWDALGPRERRVLGAACIPGRPFAAGEIEAILPDLPDTLDALAALRDRSLLAGPPGALAVPSTIRTFVRQRPDGIDPALRAAWAESVLSVVRPDLDAAIGLDGPALLRLYERRSDLANIAPVAVDRQDLAVALALALRYPGPWAAARRALEDAILQGPDARLLVLLGEYRLRTGEIEGARSALAEAQRSDAPRIRAAAALLAARIEVAVGRPAEALALVDPARRDAIEAGAIALEAMASDVEGSALAALGQTAAASERYAEAVRRASGPGLAASRGVILQNHAAVLGRAGDHEGARPLLAAAVADLGTLPFPHLAGMARLNLGLASLNTGRDAEAVAELEQTAALARRIGDHPNEILGLGGLGVAALLTGQPALAEAAAERLGELVDDPSRCVDPATLRCLVALDRGDLDTADAEAALAVVLARRAGRAALLADSLLYAAAVARRRGLPHGALVDEAVALVGRDHPLAAVLDGRSPTTGTARLLKRLLGPVQR